MVLLNQNRRPYTSEVTEGMQLKYKNNYQRLRRLAWPLSQFLYHARGYGLRRIEGPALMVFTTHPFSSDSMLLSYLESYTSIVYREKKASSSNLLTQAGRSTGGIVVRENGHRFDYRRFLFMLKNREVVGMFPYGDVNGPREYGIIELAMRFEQRHGHIAYIPASVGYHQPFHRRLCWPGTQMPMWFITRASIFVGTPISSDGHQTAESLVELLLEKGKKLQETYR